MVVKSKTWIIRFFLIIFSYAIFCNDSLTEKSFMPSFEERIELLQTNFKGMQKSNDFKIEIIALSCKGYSLEEFLRIINRIKQLSKEQNSVLKIEYFYEAFIFEYYKTDQAAYQKTEKERSWTAYHEAAHAVAVILADDKLQALHYVTIKGVAYSGGHYTKIPLALGEFLNCSDEEIKQNLENAIQDYLAGGIGEQLYGISCLDRVVNNFHEIDKNVPNYDFLDSITRYSVSTDVEEAFKKAEIIIELFGNGDNLKSHEILLQQYRKIKPILEKNRDKINKLAQRLLEKETIFADEAYEICGKKRPRFYFEK